MPYQHVRQLGDDTDELELVLVVRYVHEHLVKNRAMSVDDWNGICSAARARRNANRGADQAKHWGYRF